MTSLRLLLLSILLAFGTLAQAPSQPAAPAAPAAAASRTPAACGSTTLQELNASGVVVVSYPKVLDWYITQPVQGTYNYLIADGWHIVNLRAGHTLKAITEADGEEGVSRR